MNATSFSSGHILSTILRFSRRNVRLHLLGLLDAHDPVTGRHSREVGTYAQQLAQWMGLPPDTCQVIRHGAALHDVGKLCIPLRILQNTGPLSDADRQIMQTHAQEGARLLEELALPSPLIVPALAHHEWWNGQGYPARLKGEVIPLAARITAVADVFSAITSDRPYQRARPVPEACAILRDLAGVQLDPDLAQLFVAEISAPARGRYRAAHGR